MQTRGSRRARSSAKNIEPASSVLSDESTEVQRKTAVREHHAGELWLSGYIGHPAAPLYLAPFWRACLRLEKRSAEGLAEGEELGTNILRVLLRKDANSLNRWKSNSTVMRTAARRSSHNLKVVGSNPTPATKFAAKSMT